MCIGGSSPSPSPTDPAPLPEPAKSPTSNGVQSSDEARRRAILAAGLQNETGPRGILTPAETTGATALGG